MKYRNSFIFLILFVIFVLLLSACSTGSQSISQSTSSSSSSENRKGYPQGVSDNEIVIGHFGPQSGPTAIYDSARKAAESYIKYINENGGVNGRKIKMISYDDGGQPAKATQAVKRLVEQDKVYAIVGAIGTVSNLAVLDYYKEKGIPVIMMGSGSTKLVEPPIRNVIGLGVINYGVEAKILLDYTVNELGAKKIAIAYQNDDLGKEGYQTVKINISKYNGVEIVQEVNFLTSDVEFTAHAQKIAESNPDVVMVFSSPNPVANLKKALYKLGMNNVPFVVNSVGANDTKMFELAGPEVWEGTISAATIPMPGTSDNESLKLFVERFSKDFPNEPIVGVSQSGWAQMEVFVEAVRLAGEDLSWDNLLNSLYKFDKWKGSMYAGVSFSPENHYGSTSLFMTKAEKGKIVPISKIMTYDPATNTISIEQ
ncbi:ABC transporter substrate-binding protein [Calidifontibacillus erzurumensis]|uniref:ABC transporter substrate-binding protein n=1 Tax=Calidifontibacillus erzurumensis TaxID=2741433 RepID=A0A8J8K793_9BACI|nr:ABC transporter substrate-binding protein [Calidifontibacillus erzurumensis]NSL50511.1 ABC transporter substrate-binding protein [Calidifontibacillus erzurumensis]